jgi:hypothetical protein
MSSIKRKLEESDATSKDEPALKKVLDLGLGEPFSEHEIAFAKANGATDRDIEDMRATRYARKQDQLYGEESQYRDPEEEARHDDACDCNDCRDSFFEGECDENNDGGVQATREWREGVARAKVKKAIATLRSKEQFILDCMKRYKDYREKIAREAQELADKKKAYVHVEGTSALLSFGMVPKFLERKLLGIPGIKDVDVIAVDKSQLRCRLHVEWPPEDQLEPSKRDAYMRVLLQQEGIAESTSADIVIATRT